MSLGLMFNSNNFAHAAPVSYTILLRRSSSAGGLALPGSDNPIALEVRSNFDDCVPYDDKTGKLVYEDMIPGMYYYDPDKKNYVTNAPATDTDPGGFFVVDPITFEKRKLKTKKREK